MYFTIYLDLHMYTIPFDLIIYVSSHISVFNLYIEYMSYCEIGFFSFEYCYFFELHLILLTFPPFLITIFQFNIFIL